MNILNAKIDLFKTESEKNYEDLKKYVNRSTLPNDCKTYLKNYIEKVSKNPEHNNPFIDYQSFGKMIENLLRSDCESKEELERRINNITQAMNIIKKTVKFEDYVVQSDRVIENLCTAINGKPLDFNSYLYSILGFDNYWKAINIAIENNLDNSAIKEVETLIIELSKMLPTDLLGNHAINYLSIYNNILEGHDKKRQEIIQEVNKLKGVYDISQKDLELFYSILEELTPKIEEEKQLYNNITKLKPQLLELIKNANNAILKADKAVKNGEAIINEAVELGKKDIAGTVVGLNEDKKIEIDKYIKKVTGIELQNVLTEIKKNSSIYSPEVIKKISIIEKYIPDNLNYITSEQLGNQLTVSQDILNGNGQERTPIVVSGIPQTTIIQQKENTYFIEPNEKDFNMPTYVNGLIEKLRKEKDRINIIKRKIEKLKSEGQYVHSAAEEVAIELVNGYSIPYLWGPTNSGKSYMTTQVLKILYEDIKFIRVSPIKDPETVGSFISIDGKFVPNDTYYAIKYGHPLVLEEIDNWDPTAVKEIIKKYISPAYKVINDPENTIGLPFANILTVPANPNFRAILTGNTSGDGMENGYICSNKFDSSVLSSIVKIYVDYDNELEKSILHNYPTWFDFTQEMRQIMETYTTRNISDKDSLEGYLFTTGNASIISEILNERKKADGSLYRIVKNYIIKGNCNEGYLQYLLEQYVKRYHKEYKEKTKDIDSPSEKVKICKEKVTSIDSKETKDITQDDIAFLCITAIEEQKKILLKR